jgi:intracellular multiplication protein IcmE
MEIKRRIRPSRKWLMWMGAVAVSTLIVLGVSIAFRGPDKEDKGGGAKVGAFKPRAPKAVVGGKPATEAYNQIVREQDNLLAAKAQKEGISIMPTVLGDQVRPNVKKVEPEPPKELPDLKRPPVERKPPVKTGRSRRKESEDFKRYKASMLKDVKFVLDQKRIFQPHTTISFAESAKSADTVESSNQQTNTPDSAPELPPLPFKSGDILYSSNVIKINSDVPSPVVATVASGAYKDTQFFGNFSRHEKYLLLRFDRLKTPDGDEYPVNAIAIDPETSSAAVRSRVDSHYMERWGGLVAASLLEGFGESTAKSGQSFKSTETTETFTYPEYSVDEQAWIAAGKVGSRLANIMERNFERPPTVYEDSQAMIGIMILSTKR